MKATLAVVWMLCIGVIAYAAGMTSLGGWTVLVVLALAPAAVMMRFWRVPARTMSESIQDALR